MYITTHINQLKMKTKVLQTPNDILKGMMGKKFTGEFNALLFVLHRKNSPFWMKNCIIPLDIIFINDGKITKIHHNCPPCATNECKRYPGDGNLVIEMRGGTCRELNIRRGAKVEFSK